MSENPAVLNPAAVLTRVQKDALCSIAFYKNQCARGTIWIVGNKRFSVETIRALKAYGLLAGHAHGVWPTTAGKLAIDKLKGATA